MRTFSCFTYDGRTEIPTLSFVFAADEWRARGENPREVKGAVAVEICENGVLVGTERIVQETEAAGF